MDNKKSYITWSSFVVPIGTLILSIVLSIVQEQVKLGILIFSLIISTLVYLGILWILSKFISKEIIEDNESLKEELIKKIDMKLGLDDKLLMSTEDGVDFEKKRKICDSCERKRCKGRNANNDYKCEEFCEEIWLFTQDLEEDKEGGTYSKIVTDNLNKGIKCIYIVPENVASIVTKANGIIKNNNNSPNLKFHYLDKNFFFLSSELDIAIYNPIIQRGAKRKAFMGIPLEGKEERYQVSVSDDFIDAIVGMIHEQIK